MTITLSGLILLAVSFLGALAASWILLLPFFQEESTVLGTDQGTLHHRELLARKERAMEALEDLELDRISGKVPGDLYTSLKTELTDEAADSLNKLDTE